jgi:hypothetical protein
MPTLGSPSLCERNLNLSLSQIVVAAAAVAVVVMKESCDID